MRLLFVRHGDPNYELDTLTEKGWQEAEALSEYIKTLDIQEIYVSPLGRARDTANVSLNKMHRSAETLPWLREFKPRVYHPNDPYKRHCAWDWMPADWTNNADFYNPEKWYDHPAMKEAHVLEAYTEVIPQFRAFLKDHGYEKDGHVYKVLKNNHDTICFFCHFGIECLLLSDLFSISPMSLWHCMFAAPTSITSVVTEERQQGVASFRMNYFGNTTHLYLQQQDPSFSGRYAECFEDTSQH